MLAVAVTSSPGRGSGASDVVVVQQRCASPPPRPAPPRQEAAAKAPAAPAATRLTVSLPPGGCPAGYSIRADAGSSAAAVGSGGSSPIKAWRPAHQQQQPWQQGGTTTVSVDVVASPAQRHREAGLQPPQVPQAEQPAPAGHLQQLAGEIRRREQSFNSLLAELEAIQQKCAKLSGPAGSKAPAAPAAAGAAGQARPRSARKGGPGGPPAAGPGAPGGQDWSWQSLSDFEATIREQQRKVRGGRWREGRGMAGQVALGCVPLVCTQLPATHCKQRPPLRPMPCSWWSKGVLPPEYL